MIKDQCILIVEDEPLILMDMEYAAEERGCEVLVASNTATALRLVDFCGERIDAAVLDVSLGKDKTCYAVATELDRREIPYVLHSGDFGHHDERIRKLKAQRIAKPTSSNRVIEAALNLTATKH